MSDEQPAERGEPEKSGSPESASEQPAPGASSKDEVDPEGSTMLPMTGTVTVRLETVANILTAAVAIAAILLSVWEGVENRRHNRLSVLPHLEPITETRREGPSDTTYTIRYAVANTGLGPAVLENVIYFRNEKVVFDTKEAGERYSGFYSDIDNALDSLSFRAGLGTSARGAGELLKAGEEHVLMQIIVPATVDDSLEQWAPGIVRDRVLSNRSYVFCYCSVYEEDCDQTRLGAELPEEDVCDF